MRSSLVWCLEAVASPWSHYWLENAPVKSWLVKKSYIRLYVPWETSENFMIAHKAKAVDVKWKYEVKTRGATTTVSVDMTVSVQVARQGGFSSMNSWSRDIDHHRGHTHQMDWIRSETRWKHGVPSQVLAQGPKKVSSCEVKTIKPRINYIDSRQKWWPFTHRTSVPVLLHFYFHQQGKMLNCLSSSATEEGAWALDAGHREVPPTAPEFVRTEFVKPWLEQWVFNLTLM